MKKITIVLACMFIGMIMLVEPALAGPSATIDADLEAEKLNQLMEQDVHKVVKRSCVS